MNIRHLRFFITVADTGSMTKAAKKLFITQPSVSQTIMELESYYDIRLFERLSKKLYLTNEGKQLLSYARHIISSFDKMEQNMKQTLKGSTIKVGATITIGTSILSQLAAQFIDSNPSTKIESVVDNTSVVENMVLKNELDFSLVEGPIHSQDIIKEPFMDDELIIICGNQHPFKDKKYIDIEELSQSDLILREKGSGTRELFENIMNSKDLTLNIKWVCNNSEAIKNAVISNIGISVISKMAVEQELQNGSLIHIKSKDIELKRKFHIIYHKNKYISQPIQDFWNLCFSYARS